MKTMILFGDSLLRKMGKELLEKTEKELEDIKVYNCATGGFNTNDGVKHVSFIAKLNPDYVILSFGANDAMPWKKQIPLKKFESNLNKIINSFKNSKIILFGCPPANDPEEPELTKKFNNQLNRYNVLAKRLAKSKKIEFIDSKKIYGNLLKKGKNYHDKDGIHLNEYGYEIMIKELVKKSKK